MALQKRIIAQTQVEGFHYWTGAPSKFFYLSQIHRHIFTIRAELVVTQDREVEFIALGREIQQKVMDHFAGGGPSATACQFGAMSCEAIAHWILGKFNLTACEVFEDGENGARVESVA